MSDIAITQYKLINKGSLVSSFNVTFAKWGGFEIRNCVLFEVNGKRWINFPSKEYESEGKKKFFPFVGFADKDKNERFKEGILKALDAHVLAMAPNNANMAAAKAQGMSDDDLPF